MLKVAREIIGDEKMVSFGGDIHHNSVSDT